LCSSYAGLFVFVCVEAVRNSKARQYSSEQKFFFTALALLSLVRTAGTALFVYNVRSCFGLTLAGIDAAAVLEGFAEPIYFTGFFLVLIMLSRVRLVIQKASVFELKRSRRRYRIAHVTFSLALLSTIATIIGLRIRQIDEGNFRTNLQPLIVYILATVSLVLATILLAQILFLRRDVAVASSVALQRGTLRIAYAVAVVALAFSLRFALLCAQELSAAFMKEVQIDFFLIFFLLLLLTEIVPSFVAVTIISRISLFDIERRLPSVPLVDNSAARRKWLFFKPPAAADAQERM
jgi:hypothetical protein